ncbi:Alkaline phosphatase synthesis transcriptional regulatory protein phoP [uncultured Clostridium sp.]|uniref:response regulator transcription factor n=1 Tax=uncultured Clostridium sp. TaxID=59620 RepID=UPI0008235165|nr:response regulator transcription factor [uncultured Clostridium sp.]SCI82164.1 Alkaline phosphatase synthesis transcriptional regulatory protein phoP [uncultured Clostridium sp.]
MRNKILIAEDDEDIIGLLKLYLEKENYEVISATNGEEALKLIQSNDISVAILDIMMPKLNGYELTKKIREIGTLPILILSARNLDSDKILGLDLGADDYLTKPFNPLEVVARVRSLIRRTYDYKNEEVIKEDEIVKVGNITINSDTFMVYKDSQEIKLTPTEFKILALLMKSPGRVFTKIQIYENVNGEYFENDDNTIMVHVYKIREKLEDDPKNPVYIKNVRGLGYKFEKV